MNRKLIIHFVFLLLLIALYAISSLIYFQNLSDIFEAVKYYSVIIVLVFVFNLIKNQKLKWTVFFVILFFPLTFLYYKGINVQDYSSADVLLILAPVNVPFLGGFIPVGDFTARVFVFYLLYFILPLLYFYGVYLFSKRMCKRIK